MIEVWKGAPNQPYKNLNWKNHYEIENVESFSIKCWERKKINALAFRRVRARGIVLLLQRWKNVFLIKLKFSRWICAPFSFTSFIVIVTFCVAIALSQIESTICYFLSVHERKCLVYCQRTSVSSAPSSFSMYSIYTFCWDHGMIIEPPTEGIA